MSLFGLTFSIYEIIILSALLSFLVIQLWYIFFFYFRIIYRKKKIETTSNEPISVIICARNEEVNLKNNLSFILNQKYPNYEVIVVNDCSEDDTLEVLKSFSNSYSHLRYTTIKKDEKFSHSKKLAVMVGIKAAKNENLLFTDADCIPNNEFWIQKMSNSFVNKEIVIGYSGFIRKKGLLNIIIRSDAFNIAIQYLSFAMAGMPYMAVGRNMAYKKSLFFKNKGFASHLDLDSGDDDLFINETATKRNTGIQFQFESQTKTRAASNFSRWVRQKTRHRTTFSHYKNIHKFWLSLEPLSRTFFYTTFILGLFIPNGLYISLIIFTLRLILQLIVNYLWSKHLKERDLFLFSPLYDFISIFIGMYLVLKGMFRRKKISWK